MQNWPRSAPVSRIAPDQNQRIESSDGPDVAARSFHASLSRAQQDKSFAESVLSQQMSAGRQLSQGQIPKVRTANGRPASTTGCASIQIHQRSPDVIKAKSDIGALKQKMAESDQHKKMQPPEKTLRRRRPAQNQQLRAQIHNTIRSLRKRTQQQDDIQKSRSKIVSNRVQSSPAVEQEYKLLTRDIRLR